MSEATMGDPTAPGWYEDTGDPLRRNYWDGSRWVATMRYVDGSWHHQPLTGRPGHDRTPGAGAAAGSDQPSNGPGGWSDKGQWLGAAAGRAPATEAGRPDTARRRPGRRSPVAEGTFTEEFGAGAPAERRGWVARLRRRGQRSR